MSEEINYFLPPKGKGYSSKKGAIDAAKSEIDAVIKRENAASKQPQDK
jgi:hypothetical protein